jgi:hypothetical protein
MLKASLDSLRKTCADPKNIEAIVIFDEDDLKTIEGFKELKFDFKVLQIISKRYGYYGLHHYINNAFTISSGKWFWLWNDDLKMVGSNWDEVISEYGLLRQYIPKKRPLSNVSDAELRMIQDRLNNRPRKRLGFKTPNEVFMQSLNRVALRV